MAVSADAVVIGAGIVGSAIAYYLAKSGLEVHVVDTGLPASGTSSRCEGNILVSDKELGPELNLARYSLGLWKNELAEFGHLWEFEAKGGVIVASFDSSMESLNRFSAIQKDAGIDVQTLDSDRLRELEPHITSDAIGAAWYPEDSQVQPMLAAFHLLHMAVESGATFSPHQRVNEILRDGNIVTGVRTRNMEIHAPVVVNASGTWAGEVSELAGAPIPVLPRRGFIMVTTPQPQRVFHKVYAAEYVDNVGSSSADLQASPVVESTPAGSILLGSSRERVGFDNTISITALSTIAANAMLLFPFLEDVPVLRHYHGFRPYCPDHLPVIGEDHRLRGFYQAAGHEGAGIGLSVGTGKLISQLVNGQTPDLDVTPFRPNRFDRGN